MQPRPRAHHGDPPVGALPRSGHLRVEMRRRAGARDRSRRLQSRPGVLGPGQDRRVESKPKRGRTGFSDFCDFLNEETASFKKKKKSWATDIKNAEGTIKELKQELNEKISELKVKLAQFYDAPKVVDPRNAAVAAYKILCVQNYRRFIIY